MTERTLVSNLLFGRPLELPHFPGFKTCQTGPVGVNTSTFRGKTARAEGPKLSNVARVIEKVLDGKVQAICSKDAIYTEFEENIRRFATEKQLIFLTETYPIPKQVD